MPKLQVCAWERTGVCAQTHTGQIVAAGLKGAVANSYSLLWLIVELGPVVKNHAVQPGIGSRRPPSFLPLGHLCPLGNLPHAYHLRSWFSSH
jgi:hypothetical protein